MPDDLKQGSTTPAVADEKPAPPAGKPAASPPAAAISARPAPAPATAHGGAAHAPPGAVKVPAFPEGEAVFPEEPPIAGPPDLGHWVLQGALWGLLVICGSFVVVGCVHIVRQLVAYYR